MLKDTGVYTAKCPECSRSILIHLLSDGSISPNECPGCEIGFEGIDKGEQHSTFVIVAKTKQSKIVVEKEEAEETKKNDGMFFETSSSTKKAGRKSSKKKP